jgi:hypothetical protein
MKNACRSSIAVLRGLSIAILRGLSIAFYVVPRLLFLQRLYRIEQSCPL